MLLKWAAVIGYMYAKGGPFYSNDVIWLHQVTVPLYQKTVPLITGDPLHSRALAHSRAPLFTQPCPHCSHSRAPGEQWARLCVFTLQGCVQAARLCRGSPVLIELNQIQSKCCDTKLHFIRNSQLIHVYHMRDRNPKSMAYTDAFPRRNGRSKYFCLS